MSRGVEHQTTPRTVNWCGRRAGVWCGVVGIHWHKASPFPCREEPRCVQARRAAPVEARGEEEESIDHRETDTVRGDGHGAGRRRQCVNGDKGRVVLYLIYVHEGLRRVGGAFLLPTAFTACEHCPRTDGRAVNGPATSQHHARKSTVPRIHTNATAPHRPGWGGQGKGTTSKGCAGMSGAYVTGKVLNRQRLKHRNSIKSKSIKVPKSPRLNGCVMWVATLPRGA